MQLATITVRAFLFCFNGFELVTSVKKMLVKIFALQLVLLVGCNAMYPPPNPYAEAVDPTTPSPTPGSVRVTPQAQSTSRSRKVPGPINTASANSLYAAATARPVPRTSVPTPVSVSSIYTSSPSQIPSRYSTRSVPASSDPVYDPYRPRTSSLTPADVPLPTPTTAQSDESGRASPVHSSRRRSVVAYPINEVSTPSITRPLSAPVAPSRQAPTSAPLQRPATAFAAPRQASTPPPAYTPAAPVEIAALEPHETVLDRVGDLPPW